MTEDGFKAYEKIRLEFKQGRRTGKKPINSMSLEECLEAQRKYLSWVDKYPTHEEISVKKHIYETYLLPRIVDLEFSQSVEKGLL